jgi:hypothetical protein
MEGSGRFDNADNALLVRDAVKGALATLKLSFSGDRDAVDVVNKIDISTDQREVHMKAVFTRDDLQRIIKHRPGLALR